MKTFKRILIIIFTLGLKLLTKKDKEERQLNKNIKLDQKRINLERLEEAK